MSRKNYQPGLFSSSDVEKTSDELRSESMQNRWQTEEHRAKVREGMANPEVKAKISNSAKAYWAKLSPEERRERLKKAHSAVKGGHQVNSLEATVIMYLNTRRVFYRVHDFIEGYVADVFVHPNLIIECDGKAWHDARSEGDAERDRKLTEAGYNVLRLTEAEITAGDWTRLDEALTG